jgi:hypothetical protein
MSEFQFASKLSFRMRKLCLTSSKAAAAGRRPARIFRDLKTVYSDQFTAMAAVNRS